jgi:hypothetical protein
MSDQDNIPRSVLPIFITSFRSFDKSSNPGGPKMLPVAQSLRLKRDWLRHRCSGELGLTHSSLCEELFRLSIARDSRARKRMCAGEPVNNWQNFQSSKSVRSRSVASADQ